MKKVLSVFLVLAIICSSVIFVGAASKNDNEIMFSEDLKNKLFELNESDKIEVSIWIKDLDIRSVIKETSNFMSILDKDDLQLIENLFIDSQHIGESDIELYKNITIGTNHISSVLTDLFLNKLNLIITTPSGQTYTSSYEYDNKQMITFISNENGTYTFTVQRNDLSVNEINYNIAFSVQ